MAETAAFGMAVCAVVYLMYWLWKNDEGVPSGRKAPFRPSDSDDQK